MIERLLLLGIILVDLYLYPHRFFLPEVSKLLSTPPSSKLDLTVRHVALSAVHEPLKAMLVLWVVVVRIRMIGVEPGAAEVTEVRVALRACHVVAAKTLLAWNRTVGTWRCVLHDEIQRSLVVLGKLGRIAWLTANKVAVPGSQAHGAKRKVTVLTDCEPLHILSTYSALLRSQVWGCSFWQSLILVVCFRVRIIHL